MSTFRAEPSALRARLRLILREPLLHFLIAGLALFVVYRALNPVTMERAASNEITVTEDDLRQIAATWLAQGRPPPTPEQMKNLVEAKVREEIFFREAQALGLEKNDTIVKRRLAQKMEFLAEDLSDIGDPTPDELKAWFEKNPEGFASAPRASFRHLYFSPDRRGARARADAAQLLEMLRGEAVASPAAAGLADAFMFQDYYGDLSFDQLASIFGQTFAQSLFELAPGAWRGPIESGYGWHLVWIDAMEPERIPAFEEVEPEVRREWIAARRIEGKRKLYEAIRARYQVILPELSAGETSAPGERP
jgi:peptidyl-prolyl cis-trans isomerase C